MAANGTALGPNKAHRVSRHVSFQAVVPPAVSFPVNYSGPSLIQANNHVSLARQSIADSQTSDISSEEFKQRTGRQMSSVISLDYNRDSTDGSISNSMSSFDKIRNRFTFLNIPKKKHCFLENLHFNCKTFTISKRRCLLITSALIFCVVLILIIIAVSITATSKYMNPSAYRKIHLYTSEICENPACLRIGLFFQATLFNINERGMENCCSDSALQNLVKLMWDGEVGSDITLQSPFATAVEQILEENSAKISEFANCISNASTPFLTQNLDDFGQKEKSIAKLLHDVTLTYNSFDEVLHTVHIQYKIPLFFEIRTQGSEIEISTPTRIQPWDNFNLRHIQSRFSDELRRYICSVLNYAQSIGIILNFNSTDNCDRYDSDRVNAVYGILQMLQEVKMMEKAQNMRLNGKDCRSMSLSDLNAFVQNTVNFFALMRNFPGRIRARICNTDVIQAKADIIRHTRSSDLQDFIFFSVLNEFAPRYHNVAASAKHRLLSLAFGNIGLTSRAMCIFQPRFEQQLFGEKSNDLKAFWTYESDEVFVSIKKTFENYFKESPSIAVLINEMKMNKHRGPYRNFYIGEKAENYQTSNGQCVDIGLCSYGSQMLLYDWNKKELDSSLLLLFDRRFNIQGLNPRVTTYAFLGYWISLSIADALFKFMGEYGFDNLPASIGPLFKCVLSDFQQEKDHLFATEYMERIRIMKTALTLEMVSRAYLESKSNSSFSRIPGVNLPEDQIFYIMLIQTICTKPPYLDFGLTEVCESALKAMQMSPTFVSLVGCSPARYVSLNLTDDPDSPITRILPSDCFP